MKSQPQKPEFKIIPEKVHLYIPQDCTPFVCLI